MNAPPDPPPWAGTASLTCGMDASARPGNAGVLMKDFVHQAAAARVVFGPGSIERLPAECTELGLTRVLVIAGGAASAAGDRAAELLGSRVAGRLGRVVQHVPEQLAADAVAATKAAGATGLCSVGGGSATGLAKAVAVELDLPIVAVPTTYAGSEATPVYGITGEQKRTATDPRVRPRVVIYDPALTVDLPAAATAASGYNALAHAVAALAGAVYEPVARLHATEAIRLIGRALPAAVARPGDLDARGELLWAAWLAGTSLAATGGGLHHRLCHLIGGRSRLVHADVHAVLLPHTVARDESLSLGGAAAALGLIRPDPPATDLPAAGRRAQVAAALHDLAREVGAPASLQAIGLAHDVLDTYAQQAADVIGGHDPTWFRDLLDQAYHPVRPTQGGRT
jgi:maleylacetate reductase